MFLYQQQAEALMLQFKGMWLLLGLPVLTGWAAGRYTSAPRAEYAGGGYVQTAGASVAVPSAPAEVVELYGSLPPGLERRLYERDHLPPGLERRLGERETLPPGLAWRGGFYGVWSYPVISGGLYRRRGDDDRYRGWYGRDGDQGDDAQGDEGRFAIYGRDGRGRGDWHRAEAERDEGGE
jgi:hypothetical protein